MQEAGPVAILRGLMSRPTTAAPPTLPTVDVREHGAPIGGETTPLDRRLFMQLLVFSAPQDVDVAGARDTLIERLQADETPSVVYADVNDPRGIGLLSWDENPRHFLQRIRPLFAAPELRRLVPKPGLSLFGRTYGSGYERDLAHWLLQRPKDSALQPDCPWALWYPLRRAGSFQGLDRAEQGAVVREHAVLGRAYGTAGHVHDLRLACYGVDTRDNEFIIGLVGKDLQPLSHLIQAMRATRQTAEYIDSMGPFFVGHVSFRQAGTPTTKPPG